MSKRTKATQGRSMTQREQPVFLVLSDKGLYWDGAAWVPDPKDGMHFYRPPDAWADCDKVAQQLCAAGTPCSVAGITLKLPNPNRE